MGADLVRGLYETMMANLVRGLSHTMKVALALGITSYSYGSFWSGCGLTECGQLLNRVHL